MHLCGDCVTLCNTVRGVKEECLLFYKGWICFRGKPFSLIFIILKGLWKCIPHMNTKCQYY